MLKSRDGCSSSSSRYRRARKLGASFSPYSNMQTRTSSSSEHTPPKSRLHAIGTHFSPPPLSARDTELRLLGLRTSFPSENALKLAFVLIDAAARVIATGRTKVTLRKLFVAITSLALKLVPARPSQWPDWILSVITTLSGGGAQREHILEFLQIAAQEVGSSDLVSTSKCVQSQLRLVQKLDLCSICSRSQMQQSLLDAVPLVTDAIRSALMQPNAAQSEQAAAFKCLEAWISVFNAK